MVWIYLKNCMCLGKKHYQDDTEPVLPNSKNEHQNSAAENFDIEIFEDSNTKNCNKELFTELFNNLADLKEKQKFVDGIILTQSGYFAKNCSNDGTIKFYSGDVIANKDKIRKYQTKVKFVSKYGEAICTVINFGGHEMELKFRYLNLSNYGKLNGRFQASLCSNDKQLKHIEEGFRIITRHKEMVEKVWAQNSELIQNGPNMHIFENGRNAVEELIETNDSELTLICAETNDAVKSITAKLKKKMPQMFVDGLAIRLITQKYSNSAEYTKTFADITNFSALNIIICTIGVAPKLASHCNISNIFIMNAETVSELDSWMIIGMLATVDTKIFLSGHLSSTNVVWGISSLSSIKKEGCISMFERLSKFPDIKEQILSKIDNKNVEIVFEL